MYTLYIPVIGEVILRLATIRFSGYNIYISGHDEEHNRIDFVFDKIKYPDDHHKEFGYCHILSYTMRGQTVPCNYYRSIH